LPFDNEVVQLKLIIEVHGEQHYRINIHTKKQATKNKTSPEEILNEQKWRDKYKKNLAIKNDYEYLELSYKTNDFKETWKKLIDKKIKEIIKRAAS
jgi:hypothetical protein